MIDWSRLEALRERRRQIAQEELLARRRDAEAQSQRLCAAEQAHALAERAKASHWHAAAADPTLNAAGLANAAAWSRVLDRHIAQERQAVDSEQSRVDACDQALAKSRAALRRAAGGVEKAARMGQQARGQARRGAETRLESVADEWAAAKWFGQRPRSD